MLARARLSFDPAKPFPPFPGWARIRAAPEAIGEAGFFAGAALAALYPVARDEHALGKLWRQRLALANSAILARHAGRSEDEAALRDAFYLRRAGDDPGPAGNIFVTWRKLGEPDALKFGDWSLALAEVFGLRIDGAFKDLIEVAAKLSKGEGCAVAGAAEIAAISVRLRADQEALALWLADAVLAARLKWPAPVPLLAGPFLSRSALRAAPQYGRDAGAWLSACCLAYARAAAQAVDLHADLARRARKLIAAAPKLRGKAADGMIARYLSEDAHAAAGAKTTSERSARRLLERLKTLGVVRELTGRPTFRLYNLRHGAAKKKYAGIRHRAG